MLSDGDAAPRASARYQRISVAQNEAASAGEGRARSPEHLQCQSSDRVSAGGEVGPAQAGTSNHAGEHRLGGGWPGRRSGLRLKRFGRRVLPCEDPRRQRDELHSDVAVAAQTYIEHLIAFAGQRWNQNVRGVS